MNKNTNIKSIIFAAAISLGLTASVSAQNANVAVPAPSDTASTAGLLGSRYTEVSGTYFDLTGGGAPSVARGLSFNYNQPIQPNIDLNLGYDWARAKASGIRFTEQSVNLGATAFTNLSWGRPFVLASAGWIWDKANSVKDNSFSYKLGVGSEFQVLSSLTVTPFVTFARATGYNNSEVDFGVKAAYRLSKEWSATARVQYDAIRHSKDVAEYSLGLAYRF